MSDAPNQSPISDTEHVRKRPGMYIGGLTERGLRHLLHETISDELSRGGNQFSRVKVVLLRDGFYEIGFTGACAEILPINFVEFSTRQDHISAVDLPVLSALSDPLHAEVIRDGQRWRQSFAAGISQAEPVRDIIDAPSGLRLKYRPDPSLFKDASISYFRLCSCMREFAIFHRQTTFQLGDYRNTTMTRQFRYSRGLVDFAEEMEYDHYSADYPAHPYHLEISEGTQRAQALIIRRCSGPYVVHSFANNQRTTEGSHVRAFETAFKKVVANHRERAFEWKNSLKGLTVLLAVLVDKIEFEGPTRDRLGGEVPARLVTQMINEQLPTLLK